MTARRVLFVYRALSKGGTGSVIFNRMRQLILRNIEVRALYFLDHGGMEDQFREQILVSQDEEQIKNWILAFDPDWVLHFDTPELVSTISEWKPTINQVYEVHTTYRRYYKPVRDEMLPFYPSLIILPSNSITTQVILWNSPNCM